MNSIEKNWKNYLLNEYTILGLSKRDAALETAINNNLICVIEYKGDETVSSGRRAIEPVVLGVHTHSGNPVVRAWQRAGATDTPDNMPGWRLFRVDKISSLKVTEEKFTEPRPAFNPNDSAIVADAVVTYDDLQESWKKFLVESWDDDLEGVIKDREENLEASKARLKQFMARKRRAKDAPLTGEEDWEEMMAKEKEEMGREEEEAWAERESTKSIVRDNVETILNTIKGSDLFYHFIDAYADNVKLSKDQFRKKLADMVSLAIESDKKNPLNHAKVQSVIGSGGYGIVFQLNNDHLFKLFKDGMRGMKSDLKWYQKMYNNQFTQQSEPGELAVYSYGTIKSPPFKTSPNKPLEIGYAEIGKVLPFGMWLQQNNPSIQYPQPSIELFNNLRDFLGDMASDNDWNKDSKGNRKVDPISAYPDEHSYIRHILGALLRYQGSYMPQKDEDGWDIDDLKKILKAIYRISVQEGDEYLFHDGTSDIHAGNFGFSIQTGNPVIFDK